MDEKFKENVKKLLDMGLGDKGRLDFILSSLENGKKIYNTDMKYVEKLITKTLDDKKNETTQDPIDTNSSKSKKPLSDDSKVNQSPVQFDSSSSNKPHKHAKTPRIDATSYGITYHVSGRNEVKIHHNSCRFYQNASQSGSTKWAFRNGYQNAKSDASSIAKQHSTYYKNAQCCLNGIISRSLSAALFLSLFPFLGLLGNLIIRDYYPTLGTGLKYFGLAYGVIAIIFYAVNNISYFIVSLIGSL